MNKKSIVVDKYSTVYSLDVYVVLNPSKEELDKRFEWSDKSSIYDENFSTKSAYCCMGATNKETKQSCFVVIFNKLSTDDAFNINTIAHEAFHVTMDILDECDLQYSDDSCEAYAYLQGYITECIYKTIKNNE